MSEQNTLAQVLDGMTVPDLRAYADKNGVDLSGLTRKADIIEKIAAGTGATDAGADTSAGDGEARGAGSSEYYGDVDETRLDDHVDRPSTVAPGDAPHDTTDPTEEASAVIPDAAAAARAGHGTVNNVVPVKRARVKAAEKAKDRIERYEATRPNGEVVLIEHNIDTGSTAVVDVVSPAPARA